MTGPKSIESLVLDETARRSAFPICQRSIFLAHAAVAPLPRVVADAIIAYTEKSVEAHQEFEGVLEDVKQTRQVAARLIGAEQEEIALLGPTSLGLSLFANGLPWQVGDEVLCYADDYPANVYPWIELRRRGVTVRYLQPESPGAITTELIEKGLSEKTRLVALATANFLAGYRIDVEGIGKLLGRRGVLFSLDAIQTLGAFPLSVEHVDFLSADAHKWLLGPLAGGIVYVKKKHFELLRPTLLGAWNVVSPSFIASDEVKFVTTAQRYEPGSLNIIGILGMKAAIELILEVGPVQIAARVAELRSFLAESLLDLHFDVAGGNAPAVASGIVSASRTGSDLPALFRKLQAENVVASLRFDRRRSPWLRFSPHFYNTTAELERVAAIIRAAL